MEKSYNSSQAEKQVREQIIHFFQRIFGPHFDRKLILIDSPPNPRFGDFSVACHRLAKQVQQNPVVLSKSLSDQFLKMQKDFSLLESVQSMGAYLNFSVNIHQFSRLVLSQIRSEGENYGNSTLGRKKKIMIEYSQPNTHKEFHIGHLRNVCIGASLVNLYRALGYQVIAANYIGDIGMHVAKCLWGYIKIFKKRKPQKERGKFLGKVYAESVRQIEQHPHYQQEVDEILRRLEGGDEKLVAIWRETRSWSLQEFQEIYKRLQVKFDVVFYESEMEEPGKKIVQSLLRRKIAQMSQGAVVVDLEKYGLKTFLILRSDKTSLYSTKDLALARLKFQKFRIEKSFYVVDSRQSLHFQQLFQTLKLMGLKKEMIHIPYEFVTLKEGAMSSRKGNIIPYETFEREMIQKAKMETLKRHRNWTKVSVQSISQALALTAMKYTMLSYGRMTPIVFDMDQATKLSGNTGPYLQYVYARISSILRKSKIRKTFRVSYQHLSHPLEKRILLMLAEFPDVVRKSAQHFDPSLLTNFLYELARLFSSYYESVPVLQAEEKIQKERLLFIASVRTVLSKGLKLLGIQPLSKM